MRLELKNVEVIYNDMCARLEAEEFKYDACFATTKVTPFQETLRKAFDEYFNDDTWRVHFENAAKNSTTLYELLCVMTRHASRRVTALS